MVTAIMLAIPAAMKSIAVMITMVELRATNQKGNYQWNCSKNNSNPFLIVLFVNSQWQLNHDNDDHNYGYFGDDNDDLLCQSQ